MRGTVLDGYSFGYPVFLVEECVFDRSRTSHLVNLFEMNAKYATVIQLSEALNYVSQLKRLEGRKALAGTRLKPAASVTFSNPPPQGIGKGESGAGNFTEVGMATEAPFLEQEYQNHSGGPRRSWNVMGSMHRHI